MEPDPPIVPPKGRGRPPRIDHIIADLVHRIASGQLPPGSRMPSRREMAETYGATVVTVQKALARMEKSKIVCSEGWRGTFVCARPPCTHRFAVLLPDAPRPDGTYPSRFYDSLTATIAARTRQSDETTWVIYDDVLSRGASLKRLVADLAAHRLGGLAVPFTAALLPLLKELERYRIPILHIGGPPPLAPRLHLEFDRVAIATRMVDRLCDLGCRRPAVAVLSGIEPSHLDLLLTALQTAGLRPPPGGVMGFDHRHAVWVGGWLEGLMAHPTADRPDGLLVADDNFVDAIQASLGLPALQALRQQPKIVFTSAPGRGLPAGFAAVGCEASAVLAQVAAVLQEARAGKGPSAGCIQPGDLA